jgi:hypothetical protein
MPEQSLFDKLLEALLAGIDLRLRTDFDYSYQLRLAKRRLSQLAALAFTDANENALLTRSLDTGEAVWPKPNSLPLVCTPST